MPSPSLFARKFTFHYDSLPDGDTASVPIPVMDVTIQLLSFDGRCFWVHLSESRALQAPPPPFGAVSMAVGGMSADVPSSLLMDDAPLSGRGGNGAPNPQAVMAQSLAQRLARRVAKEAGKAVTVYVSCGMVGEKASVLLGTPSGSGMDASLRFGADVFRHVLELIREEVLTTCVI